MDLEHQKSSAANGMGSMGIKKLPAFHEGAVEIFTPLGRSWGLGEHLEGFSPRQLLKGEQ